MVVGRTEDNNLFKIFCLKYADYLMKIIESWMERDEL